MMIDKNNGKRQMMPMMILFVTIYWAMTASKANERTSRNVRDSSMQSITRHGRAVGSGGMRDLGHTAKAT